MILLDTNAVLWLHGGHRRGRPLLTRAEKLYVSPVTLLELELLIEVGRLRLKSGAGPRDLLADDRWSIDEPPAEAWFDRTLELGWTRDPFDRLLAAHVLLRNWRLATGDSALLEHLPARHQLEL